MLRMELESQETLSGYPGHVCSPKATEGWIHKEAASRARLAIPLVNKVCNAMDNMPLGLHVVGHDERGAIVLAIDGFIG
jgi:hypothetical protein